MTQTVARGKDKYLYESVLVKRDLTRFPFRLVQKLLTGYLLNKPIGVTYYLNTAQKEVLDLIVRINGEVTFLLTDEEACQLYLVVKGVRKVDGELAEVGVFQGGSAKLISEARATGRKLHLFDTFEGLPETGQADHGLQKGDYAALFDQTRRYLKSYPDVYFHKGTFPGTAAPIAGTRFSFVHLDVDTYASTLESLQYFHPRLTRGGVILSHDYSIGRSLEGPVRKAFDEFFADKPEAVIELPTSQCLVVKTT